MAKSKPVGVRFDLDKLELIKKEKNLETPQAVLNYLMDNYASVGAPAIREIKEIANIPAKASFPPLGLKGIDLAIWRAEQKSKSSL